MSEEKRGGGAGPATAGRVSGWCGPLLRQGGPAAEPDETLHVAGKLGEAGLYPRPDKADGRHQQAHRSLLPGKDIDLPPG